MQGEWYTLKQAAEMLGKSKSAVEYHAGKLGEDERRIDPDSKCILISGAAVEKMRSKLRTSTQQAPKKCTTSTQDRPTSTQDAGAASTQQAPETAQQVPNNDSVTVAIMALTAQLEVKDKQLEANDRQLEEKDRQISKLTALLETKNEQLTAALALNAGQIQLAMQQSKPSAVPTPADDQSDSGSARTSDEHRDTAADQQQHAYEQSDGEQSEPTSADNQSDGEPVKRGFRAWIKWIFPKNK